MLFTVELTHLMLSFRLQKDGSWREYDRDNKLQESDLTCTDASDVTAHSNDKSDLEINGKIYEIEPEFVEFGDMNHLSCSSSVFRRTYPKEPTLAQLKSTIELGDDSTNNCLILNMQGDFELRQAPPFNQLSNDPSIVVRHETFVRGNDYVGPEAAADDKLMLDLFKSSLEHWKDHLKKHTTQEFSDIFTCKTLQQIQEELEELKGNWQPDY